jgi:hypothetical protein
MTAERIAYISVGEAPKVEFVVESQHDGAAHLLAGHRARPHNVAPLAAALMGSRDPCPGEDSVAVNLLPILQNWCS